MTTSWTRSAGSICNEGLEQLGIKQAGQSANPEDFQAALGALSAVLKELPLSGWVWPKLSTEAALTWSSTTPDVVALPSDFYGYPVIRANDVPLFGLTFAKWEELTNRAQTVDSAPTHFYITPANVLHLYPVPSSDPLLTILYQRIVDDVNAGSMVDVPQWMLNTLGYGVANELLFKYGVPESRAARIERRWEQKKALALANAVSGRAISFSVDDGPREWDPNNWQAPTPIPDGRDAGEEP